MQVDALTPHVYRENAFLITGLAVDAGGREIRRYRDSRHARGSLAPPVTGDVDAALGVLRDPCRRLVHELFAIWRTDSSGRPPAGVRPEVYAAHDRAVEAHRAALDLELDGGDQALRDDAWRRATALWAPLLSQQGVWDRLRSRVAAIADPRLTEADVEQLRDQLPDLMLDINARLAADGHDPERQRALMREFAAQARLGAEQVDEALERAVGGLVSSVGKACDAAQGEILADGESGLAALYRLDATVRPDLATIRRVLGEQHPATVRTHDHAAETYRLCAVRHLYAQRGSDPQAVTPYLRAAVDLAATPAAARRIREDLEQVESLSAPVPGYPAAPEPPAAAATPHLMQPSTGRTGLIVFGPVAAAALATTISTGGATLPTVSLIVSLVAACVFLVPALRPTPVLRSLVFLAIGAAVLLTGLWWGGPWVAVPGGLLLWFAAGALHTSLSARPIAQGWSNLAMGVIATIIGSLPWGGLWLGDTELWGMDHVGLWLVGYGHASIVGAAVGLGASTGRERGLTGVLVGLSGLYMGAVWLLGGGGWPAFAATIVLFLVALSALGRAARETQFGLLGVGVVLVPGAVGIVAGIGSIGVVWTLVIAAAVVTALVAWTIARSR